MKKAQLTTIDAEPVGEDVVVKLEEALEQARKGELSSIALAVVYRNGCTGNAWSKANHVGLLIASVARLQHRLLEL